MPRNNDRNYHESRAREELERAEKATDPSIAMIHRELAPMHRRRMIASIDEIEEVMPPTPVRPAGPGHQGP